MDSAKVRKLQEVAPALLQDVKTECCGASDGGTSTHLDEQHEGLRLKTLKKEEDEDGDNYGETSTPVDQQKGEVQKAIKKEEAEDESYGCKTELNSTAKCILESHQSLNTTEKPYTCLQCGKSFRQAHRLKAHQSIHTGEKLYHCSQCGKSFIHDYQLKKHQRIHNAEKPYTCSQCGMSFINSSRLDYHRRVHRPYHCSQCGMSFKKRDTLQKHEHIHTRKRQYHCSECGKSFSRKSCLLRHERWGHQTTMKNHKCTKLELSAVDMKSDKRGVVHL